MGFLNHQQYEKSKIPPIFWWKSPAKKKDEGLELLLFMLEIRLSKWYRKYPSKRCSETNCYRILFINSWLLCHGFSTGTNVKHDSHGSKPWQIMQSNRWGPCDPNLSVLQVNATDLLILDNFWWFPSKTVEHFLHSKKFIYNHTAHTPSWGLGTWKDNQVDKSLDIPMWPPFMILQLHIAWTQRCSIWFTNQHPSSCCCYKLLAICYPFWPSLARLDSASWCNLNLISLQLNGLVRFRGTKMV